MRYDDYMNSAKWRQRREDFFFEHRRLCQGCRTRARGAMELHHISYANLGHENDEDLAALCENCHESVHRRERDMTAPVAGKPPMNRAEAIRIATATIATIPSSETRTFDRPIALYTDANGNLAFRDEAEERTSKLRSLASVMKDVGL